MSARSKRLPTLVSLASTCSPSAGPIGEIMMPPLDSWSTKGRGRLSKAVQATMRSNGPSPGRPLPPSAWRTDDVGEAQLLEALPRLLDQRPVAVERDDAAAEPGHHGGGEARAGADLQHAVARLQLERGDDRRLQVDALDRLAAFDRHHAFRPGRRLPLARQEIAPRRRLEGGDQLLRGDALAAQAQQEGGESLRGRRAIRSCQRLRQFVHDLMGGEVELQRRHRNVAVAQCRHVGAVDHVGAFSRPKRSQ